MSASRPESAVRVAEQSEALTLYIEALFIEHPASLPVPVAPAMLPQRVIDVPVTRVAPVMEAPSPVAAPAAVVATVAAPTAVVSPPEVSAPPAWAAEPFSCLILRVHGLSLVLPLTRLHRIVPWTEPTPIPGYADWFLGVLPEESTSGKLKIVDTARLVMPERVVPGDQRFPPQHIVIIGDGEWGLTCEDVSTTITLDPSEVQWRSRRTKRPWLAGTVIERLSAILDAERLAEILAAGTGNFSPQ
ncbi:MAG: chemotaxis protein CheW [Gammaproteobacteria bacterium]|nr:chemotaxis protein CheW [Gammaproteobacteria bacterium]